MNVGVGRGGENGFMGSLSALGVDRFWNASRGGEGGDVDVPTESCH